MQTVEFSNGYIYTKQDAGNTRLAVDLYYSKARQDHATAATDDVKNTLKAMGYVFMSTQGYINNGTTANPDNDWRLGISSQVLEIPEGFEHETVIVVGNGVNDAMLNEFSSKLQSKYHTFKLDGDRDIVTAYLGYWTDDVKLLMYNYAFDVHVL